MVRSLSFYYSRGTTPALKVRNMNQTQISVIIPVHNSAATIRQAIDSVLAQSEKAEIYVIDDASTDEPERALLPYMEREDFHLIRNEDNLGVAKSRMKGVAAASTPYIAFLDADDWWAEGKLSRQLSEMISEGAVLSSTGRELMKSDGQSTGRCIGLPRRIDQKAILKQNHLNCSGVMVRRDVMLEFPMEHDDSHEDYISWIRIITKYGWALGIDEPFLKYRLSEKGKSRNKLKSAVMNFKVYRYCGFSIPKSLICFISYAVGGVKKYYF